MAISRPGKTLLLEIGCEELPARTIPNLGQTLVSNIQADLQGLGFGFDARELEVLITLRRITMRITNFKLQKDQAELITRSGPKLEHAIDQHGWATKQGLGFARSCGVDFAKLKQKDGRLIYTSKQKAPPLARALSTSLEKNIAQLSGYKRMRWNTAQLQFVRPIRWLCALYGKQQLAVECYGLRAKRISYGHPSLARPPLTIKHADDYERQLKQAQIIVDFAKREKKNTATNTKCLQKNNKSGSDYRQGTRLPKPKCQM